MGERVGHLGIALLQQAPAPLDVAGALARLDEAAEQAAADGAALLVAPEAALTGYNVSPEAARSIAELAEGDAFERVGVICRRHGLAVLYGFIERDGEVLRNTAQLLDRDGTLLARYRKTHLWGELDRSLFAPGDDLVALVELDGWRIGLLICYDVEFPETVRRLALEGADLVLVPTALMSPFSFVADHLVRVRAAENGVFLAYANAVGEENGLEYVGRSVIVGPDGEDLARAGDAPALIRARLERSALEKARAALPYLAERRAELYAPRTAGSERSDGTDPARAPAAPAQATVDRGESGPESTVPAG